MTIRARLVLAQIILLGLLLQSYPRLTAAVPQSDGWLSFAPPDEEIAIEIPGRPVIRTFPSINTRDMQNVKAERVLAENEYSGYGSGLVFIVTSFKAAHPQKLSDQMQSLVDKSEIFERLFFDGVPAELFRTTVNHRYLPSSRRTLRFTTTNHLYVIQLMSREEFGPAIDRFLSSVKVRQPGQQSTSIEQAVNEEAGRVMSPNEVTRRAIIVWKNEPRYTDDARAHQTKGTVTLDFVVSETGYVTDIKVVKGLEHGLTESAIAAARSIRFFPAEKD